MLKIGILGSGSGTNFEAIADAISNDELSAQITVVLSDRPDALILQKARDRSIRALYLDPGPFKTKMDAASEESYVHVLKEQEVDYVVLAGFMRVLKEGFFNHYRGKIINIHPSLLPSFQGLEAWQQALDYGVKITGCTVHFVVEHIDTGPIILQASVPVLESDTPKSLHERIHEKEYEIYPRAIGLIAEGKVVLKGRKVMIDL